MRLCNYCNSKPEALNRVERITGINLGISQGTGLGCTQRAKVLLGWQSMHPTGFGPGV